MRRWFSLGWMLLLLAVGGMLPAHGQGTDFTIAYGETQSAFYEGDDFTHRWIFFGEARDMLDIEAYRIAGQFTPRLRLLDSEGNEIAASDGGAFSDTDGLRYLDGLPATAPYQIEVAGVDVTANQTDNPAEYSLTLRQQGQRRTAPDDGLPPLPELAALPDITAGDVQTTAIEIAVYGTEPEVVRRDTPNIPERYIFTSDARELQVSNSVPLAGGVSALRFSNGGIGLLARNELLPQPVPFFTTQDMLVAYNATTNIYTFELANGTTITTDFFRVQQMQARDGVVEVFMERNGETRRLLFTGQQIDLRRSGGQGEGEARLTEIRLDDGRFISTDLLGFTTLAYLNGQMRVLFEQMDGRFLTDTVQASLRQNPDDTHAITLQVPQNPTDETDNDTRSLSMTVDWLGMGDLRVLAGAVEVLPLDGRTLSEDIANVQSLLIEERHVRYARTDGTFLTSLVDGTTIDTPAALADDDNVYPHETGFRPRNVNNLGENFFPLCPCLDDAELENKPVNPANGNFYYPVTDFYVPSHTLALDFTRYYNSQNTGITPQYMLDSPAAYLPQQMGTGWRHSYQYDLDISGAPLGRIRLILPDGTQHLFFAAENDPLRYTSRTLLGWTVQRSADVVGSWRIFRNDGVTFYFDRAGRLERISETPQRSLTLSPAPQTTQYNALGTQGVFITEPYGRRLELYAADDRRIRTARDPSARQITYQYDAARLVGVEYVTPAQTAAYTYDENNWLVEIADVRSPYQPSLTIDYDARRRVSRLIENAAEAADGTQRNYMFTYDETTDEGERLTTRRTRVNGDVREVAWTYNDLWQLIRRSTPRDDYDYEYTYDATTGLLNSIRQPTLTRYVYEFDAQANLTRFEDPFLAGDGGYDFTYQQRNGVSILTNIAYPNGGVETFTWSDDAVPQLVARQQLLSESPRQVRETRYEHDAWGRLVLVAHPDDTATVYTYDVFGYVAQIWQGITLEAGETRADIDDSSRARRVLQFDYDLIGQIRAITDGRGTTVTLNWDSSTEQLRQVNSVQGAEISYTYDAFGNVTLVDDRGQETSYTYDGLGYVASLTDAAGVVTTYDYDEAGNLLSVVDDLGRETRYAYDTLDNLTQRVSPGGLTTTYSTAVDEGGDFIIRRESDSIGREVVRRYDALGRLRRVTLTEGEFQQEYRINYNALHYPDEIINGVSGRTLALEYNLAGDVLALDLEGSRTEFAYTPDGRVRQVTSPAGRVTQYAYDPLGNITTVTLPDGRQRQYSHDENSNLLRATDAGGLVTTYIYNELNQLRNQEDPAGNSTLYTYDVRGNLTTLVDPREIAQSYDYDALDRLTAATNGSGQTTTYDYDDVGRLFNIQLPGVRSTRFTYDAEDNIIAVTERPREQRTLYSYDRDGRVNSVTDPLGHTTSYDYFALDRINNVIDPIGNVENYGWRSTTLNLASYTDSAGRTHEFNTDVLGRVTTIRDVTTEQNVAINTQLTYDDDGYIRSIQTGTDSSRVSGINDLLHTYTYAPDGTPVEYIDPAGGVWELTYDDSGRLATVVNPLDVPTRYTYDDADNITQVTRHAGTDAEAIEQFSYDAAGNITAYTSPQGVVNTYTYDPNNRLIQARLAVETAFESRYLFDYNGVGQLVRVEDPLGNETRYFYSLDNLTRVERTLDDETTVATSYTYDDAGNIRSIILPQRDDNELVPAEISLTYDALNRRVRYVNGEDNVWSYTYDAAGNIAQVSDPLGSVVRYEYDTYDRVTNLVYPTGSEIDIGYDSLGNVELVQLPRNADGQRQRVLYDVDVNGNVTEMQVGGSIRQYEYDVMGNLLRRELPDGSVTTYQYDAANHLSSIIYGNADPIPYQYDAQGNLTRAANMRFSYDPLGRLARFAGNITVDYTYDLAGNLLERDAGDAGTTTIDYDMLYRPVTMQLNGESVEVVYDNLGQIRQIQRSNGVRTILNYDAAGRPISILHLGPNNERLDGFNYQYDAVGNLIRADRITDGWRILYSYDLAHRLIDERWLNEFGETVYTASLRYDNAGNRVEEVLNGRRTTFEYDNQNRLIGEVRAAAPQGMSGMWLPVMALMVGSAALVRRRRYVVLLILLLCASGLTIAQDASSVSRVRYDYDANNNLSQAIYQTTQPGESYTLNFTYDEENRLSRVQGQNAAGRDIDTQLTYDVLSRLVRWRAAPAANFRLYYDETTLLGMENLGGESERIDQFLTLAGQRLLTRSSDAQFWHLNDQLGSTRRYADAEGALITDPSRLLEFGSFGVRIYPYDDGVAPDEAAAEKPMPFFAGHLYDPSSQMYLLGLRTYDPATARFLQPDPVRQDPFGTLYTYARNRPFVFNDTYGMTVEPFVQPTDAANLAQQLQPETLIKRPTLPEIPLPPPTHILQAAESYRALDILRQTRYGTNETIAQLSPLLDDFYLFQSNPMPPERQALSARGLDATRGLFGRESGWLPDPTPQPFTPVNPFALLDDVEPLLARAYVQPLAWCGFGDNRAVDVGLLPMLPQPRGVTGRTRLEAQLQHSLQSVPVSNALESEVQTLQDLTERAQRPAPQMALPSVDLPTVLVEPSMLDRLDHLREATYDLHAPILYPAACADCVPPLSYSP